MDTWKLEPARDFGLPMGERLRSVKREPGLLESAAHLVWVGATNTYLQICHRLRIEGSQHIPAAGPFIMASNHASHLDALTLAAALPWRLRLCTYSLAAGDTFFEARAMTAFAAGIVNALPVSRHGMGRHALDDLRRKLLEERCIYILFPEGTRTRDGEMHHFKPGIGMLVAGTTIPVLPCRLRGTFAALPSNRSVPRCHPVELRIGAPLNFAQAGNGREGWNTISSKIEDVVKEL